MPAVTETTPGTAITANAKSDVQAVPTGQDDYWCAAADMNKLLGFTAATDRAIRAGTLCALITGAETIDKKGVRLTGAKSGGLPVATAVLTTDLNKVCALAREGIEQGGDTDGTASATPFYGIARGLISGTFVTGTLYAWGAAGTLATYAGGSLAPVALGLTATTAYLNTGGLYQADNSLIAFDANGKLTIPATAAPTLASIIIGAAIAGRDIAINKSVDGTIYPLGAQNTNTGTGCAVSIPIVANDSAGSLVLAAANYVAAVYAARMSLYQSTGGINLMAGGASGTVDIYAGGVAAGNKVASIGTTALDLSSGMVLKNNGTQVVGAQGAAIADATDAPTAVTQLNLVLARLRAHGLIGT